MKFKICLLFCLSSHECFQFPKTTNGRKGELQAKELVDLYKERPQKGDSSVVGWSDISYIHHIEPSPD